MGEEREAETGKTTMLNSRYSSLSCLCPGLLRGKGKRDFFKTIGERTIDFAECNNEIVVMLKQKSLCVRDAY